MSYFQKIIFNFFILGFFWQLIIIQRANSLKINVNKPQIELQISDYLEHLNGLKEATRGLKRLWGGSSLKKQATEVCKLKPAQQFTLCQWIAEGEPYRNSKFTVTRPNSFLPSCNPRYFLLSKENNQHALEMVTCPFIKKRVVASGLNDEPLFTQPGVLSLSGSVGTNSALVFISHRRNDEIIYEPYGHVTEIDMVALKKITNLNKAIKKAIEAKVEIDNLSTKTEDSEEFVNLDLSKRPLYFKDLLGF